MQPLKSPKLVRIADSYLKRTAGAAAETATSTTRPTTTTTTTTRTGLTFHYQICHNLI